MRHSGEPAGADSAAYGVSWNPFAGGIMVAIYLLPGSDDAEVAREGPCARSQAARYEGVSGGETCVVGVIRSVRIPTPRSRCSLPAHVLSRRFSALPTTPAAPRSSSRVQMHRACRSFC